MIGKIVLLGEPKSTQHIYGILCRPYPTIYLKREGKAIKEDYSWQAKAQWAGRPMLDKPFGMRVKLFHKTKRKQDVDNFGKILGDSLNRLCYTDDNLIHELHITKHYDKDNPRIEVEFFELSWDTTA